MFKEMSSNQSLLLPSSSTTHIVVPWMDTWRECWVDLRVDLAHPDSRMLDLTMCSKKCLTTLPSQMPGSGWNLTKLRKAASWAICVISILFYWESDSASLESDVDLTSHWPRIVQRLGTQYWQLPLHKIVPRKVARSMFHVISSLSVLTFWVETQKNVTKKLLPIDSKWPGTCS